MVNRKLRSQESEWRGLRGGKRIEGEEHLRQRENNKKGQGTVLFLQ